jgi:hypothetical protein
MKHGKHHQLAFSESPWIAPKWRVVARAPKGRAEVGKYRPSFLFLCFISNEGTASVIKGDCIDISTRLFRFLNWFDVDSRNG